MRAQEFILEATEFVLYINGKPATKYQDLGSAQQDIMMLKQSQPGTKFQLKQEVCKLVDIDSGVNEDEFTEACWSTHRKVGMKKKGNRMVPDCRLKEGAVEDLEKDLTQPDSYDAIDHMMQTIARDYNITGKQLHDLFVAKHGTVPDKWTRDQLRELSFLGSECTKDCSGHRAGYNWSKRKNYKQGNSPYSPSFNKGAALAVAGK